MTIKEVLANPEDFNFDVDSLGPCMIDSPIKSTKHVGENERVIISHNLDEVRQTIERGGRFPLSKRLVRVRRFFMIRPGAASRS